MKNDDFFFKKKGTTEGRNLNIWPWKLVAIARRRARPVDEWTKISGLRRLHREQLAPRRNRIPTPTSPATLPNPM